MAKGRQVQPSEFPWGELHPQGGYRVGDYVGLIYSDHERYIFDNPTGVVVAVEESCTDADHPEPCDTCQQVTVQVEATVYTQRRDPIGLDEIFLIKRGEDNGAL